MTDDLRHRYAEALASTNTLDEIDLEYTLGKVLAVRDDELERLRAAVAEVRKLHSGPRTDRHGSGCVQCGIIWPCPTARALAALDDAKPATGDDGQHG